MPSERPFDLRGLSAPEELTLPLESHRDLRVTAFSELPQAPVSTIRMPSIKRPRRANFTAVDGSPPSRRRIFRITSIPGQRPLCGELPPDRKSTMPSEQPLDVPGLSVPEELSLPLESHRDLRVTASSELPQARVGGICVESYSQITKSQFRDVENLSHPD
ncbi:hypothetical protein Cantr_09358 [Candida viswanathii]|uniref:Uncharacterized protein n=1 Tax=Candida viswanathii TaxID=5486 RepID=A0A367YAT0_9ASCO|nr:hypothetical protein Cantr_09358 [Candida viswanathii]